MSSSFRHGAQVTVLLLLVPACATPGSAARKGTLHDRLGGRPAVAAVVEKPIFDRRPVLGAGGP